MYSTGLNFEYSRMRVPSLSSGCEIAQFFVRYMVGEHKIPEKAGLSNMGTSCRRLIQITN